MPQTTKLSHRLGLCARTSLQVSSREGQNHFRIVFLAVLFSAACFFNPTSFAKSSDIFKTLEAIPVQQAGRVKPFQSFATEVVQNVTGNGIYENHSPTELVWKWMAGPEKWNTTAMIPVHFRPLREELAKMMVSNRMSPEVLLSHEPFLMKAQDARDKKQKKEKLTRIEQERLDLYGKAALFQDIATGNLPGWIANPEDPRMGWFTLRDFGSALGQQKLAKLYPTDKVENLTQTMRNLILNLNEKPSQELAVQFRESLEALFQSRGISLDRATIQRELIYNRLHPFAWAWKLYLIGALMLLLVGVGRLRIAAYLPFLLGFVIHSYGFYLRCMIAGRPPVSNMYESIIWVSWAVVFFSLSITVFYRANIIPAIAGFVAATALIVAVSFPVVLNPAISPLVPVLRSNLWLSVHVLTITLSYGAFALAWGLGHVLIFGLAFGSSKVEGHKKMAQYLYRAIQIGVILLATGTVLGGVWANYSWGRFWGWDPKETWALIALLGYLAVLHGRLTGWLRMFGFGVGCVAGFVLVVMAWYGVNFVLASGLHSYGFGGGGAHYVLSICVLDLILLGWASFVYKGKQKALSSV